MNISGKISNWFARCSVLTIVFLVITYLLTLTGCNKENHDYENHRSSYFRNISTEEYPDTMFTCLTYNIQLGFRGHHDPWNPDHAGGTGEHLEDLVQVIKKINPTIIALQEVPRNRHNIEIGDYIEAIAEELNMNYAFGAHGYNDPTGIYPVHGEWGNAILSKHEILGIENIEISYLNKWSKRSLLSAELKVDSNKTIHVVSIHYGLRLDEYNEGLENTLAYIETLVGPVILMGDFNPQFGIDSIRNRLREAGMQDADSGFLHGGDRIFYSEVHFLTSEIGSYYDTVNWISDHPANYCKLKANGR